jgi:DNA repair protein RadC
VARSRRWHAVHRLQHAGPAALSTTELLAILINTTHTLEAQHLLARRAPRALLIQHVGQADF